MKMGGSHSTVPPICSDRKRLYHIIAFDKKRLRKSRPEMMVAISHVIKLHWLATGRFDADLETPAKCLSRGFDHRNRNDLSAINSRLRLVSFAASPPPVRSRSHMQDQF